MSDKLVDRDGWLFIQADYQYDDRPQLLRAFYPIGMRTADYRRNYETSFNGESLGDTRIGKPAKSLGAGVYEIDGLKFRLKDGDRTLAEYQETIAIPCPKVRKGIETRFNRGYWQKYLKSEGWVIA